MSEDIIVITGREDCPIDYLEHNIGKMNNENVTIYKFNKSKMNEQQLRHMKWEKEILSATNCRYIIHCIKVIETEDECQLVLENFTQNNLAEYIREAKKKNKRFQESTIRRCLANLAQGLIYLHTKRPDGSYIINRNLSPKHVMRSLSGEFVIGDFHIARPYVESLLLSNNPGQYVNGGNIPIPNDNDNIYYDSDDDEEEDGENKKEKGNTTSNYEAPELGDDKYDEKVDMWSLGCIIYEMCTLKAPYTETNHKEHIKMSKEERKSEESKLYAIPNVYSKDLKDIINKLIKFNPDNRLSSNELINHPYVKEYIDKDFKLSKDVDILENIKDLLYVNYKERESKDCYKEK